MVGKFANPAFPYEIFFSRYFFPSVPTGRPRIGVPSPPGSKCRRTFDEFSLEVPLFFNFPSFPVSPLFFPYLKILCMAGSGPVPPIQFPVNKLQARAATVALALVSSRLLLRYHAYNDCVDGNQALNNLVYKHFFTKILKNYTAKQQKSTDVGNFGNFSSQVLVIVVFSMASEPGAEVGADLGTPRKMGSAPKPWSLGFS